jgi:hypothetical protein
MAGVRPTVAEVAALLRARTKVMGGKEEGTFTLASANPHTRPTAEEVEVLIDNALAEVLGKVKPAPSGSEYETRVLRAVALYTAILIETSYYPEQAKTGQSAADTYLKLYESRIEAVIAEGETGEPQGTGKDDSPADPAWTFPEDAGGLVGYQTRW